MPPFPTTFFSVVRRRNAISVLLNNYAILSILVYIFTKGQWSSPLGLLGLLQSGPSLPFWQYILIEQLLCSKDCGYIREKGSFSCPHGVYILIGRQSLNMLSQVWWMLLTKGGVLQGGTGVPNWCSPLCLEESGKVSNRKWHFKRLEWVQILYDGNGRFSYICSWFNVICRKILKTSLRKEEIGENWPEWMCDQVVSHFCCLRK